MADQLLLHRGDVRDLLKQSDRTTEFLSDVGEGDVSISIHIQLVMDREMILSAGEIANRRVEVRYSLTSGISPARTGLMGRVTAPSPASFLNLRSSK